MGIQTGIAWTDSSFNGRIGCTEVGDGCIGCYARELDKRYQWGVPGGTAARNREAGVAPHWGDGAPRYRTSESNWKQPIKWNAAAEKAGTPKKVFCNSLSDVFDNEVDQQWREDLFALWRSTPWLRWQVLTKRVPNIRKMLPKDWGAGYPNVGLVATTVNQDEFDRDAPRLLAIPARWHGFSVEPQLEQIVVDVAGLIGLRRSVWFITGGESRQDTPGRPMIDKDTGERRVPVSWNPEWARVLIRTSHMAANVQVFVKQTGACPVGLDAPGDGAGSNPERWPSDIRVQNFVSELLS